MAASLQQPMHPEFAVHVAKVAESSHVEEESTSPTFSEEVGTSDTTPERGGEVEEASTIPYTTVVLSGIPAHFNVEDLLKELSRKGFEHRVDFVYLPMVHERGDERNVGCAYINVRLPADAVDFQRAFHSGHMESARDRPLEVSVATTQGLEANKERFGNVDHADQRHRPLVFA
eukprot:TRINITY_DN7957_c0_g1_i1.p1 TRINITY_DN7957_c0_g1~~TRINITY_DN7957_c0_g1_i1.p1  ORF type:complete len:174 (+),score=27.78 TRINITY_DN7957_c0_g1_i1:83-604(+)